MQYELGYRRTTLALISALCAFAMLIAQRDPAVSALPLGGRSLYVTNSAGDAANVARFTIDATGLVSPAERVPACDGARQMVSTPDLRFAYVSCPIAGRIGLYRADPSGALTAIGDVDLPGALGMAIAPNGRTVYASSVDDGALAAFRVESDGRLTLLERIDSGDIKGKGVAVTPDGRFVYVSHGTPMDTAPRALTGFTLDADGLPGSMIAKVTNGISGAATVITPDGRFLYVASQLSDRTLGYRIGDDGSLTAVPGRSFASGDNTECAAVAPDGRRLYVAAVGPPGAPGVVTGWSIGDDGALTEIERVRRDDDPCGIALTPAGRHLYVADFLRDKVIAFRLSPRGALRPIQTVDSGGTDPAFQSVAVLPNLGPVASFSVRAGGAGSPSRFDARASADTDGTVVRYDWNFGDGTVLRDGGPTPQHTYGTPGTYRAQLRVIDDEGCADRLVFTGQLASCVGTARARATRTVIVGQ